MTPRFDAVSIVVADMAAALAFYRLLGCDVPGDADQAPHAEWAGPGGVRLLWDTVAVVRSFDPDWAPAQHGPALSLAFNCATAAGVDATVGRLREAGHQVALEPWDAAWGQRYASVVDPDGNHVDLYAPL